MGACSFSSEASGPDYQAAFRAARAHAQHMSGHGGYTGTIAEKNHAAFAGRFTGKQIDRILRLANQVEDRTAREQGKADRDSQKRKLPYRTVRHDFSKVPEKLRLAVEATVASYADKWESPALAFEIAGQSTGRGSKRVNVYLFVGIASE